MPWGFFVARVKMRLVQYFKDGADAHGAGHFDADDVCSVALLKNGPTRSHVDIQLVAGKNLSAWQQDSAEHALNKLARTFAVQLETLKRYRTGGEQKVTVEHVHVQKRTYCQSSNTLLRCAGRRMALRTSFPHGECSRYQTLRRQEHPILSRVE